MNPLFHDAKESNGKVINMITSLKLDFTLPCLQGELLSPCRCNGSVRCTHQPCLIRWISERGSWSCELCYFKYQVLAISTKNPLQWQAISLTVIEKVQIAAIILGSLFLIASISWLVWSSLSPSAKWQRQDLLFQICYGMYGFMDIVCIGYSSKSREESSVLESHLM
ncbi:E3 ubiquitin-protein ligase MARCHF9-like [Cyprinus carpio]|uniref:RING-type E3 ubiquitin transferase n=1 Tax=Cyprinus carpio TaxID=7962 RepID=A0A9Q9YPT7_CYPCA|nr:E3 ubiquitin-protein ligase MARCHF9-like [Cyprinus carpio]